ncbi:MAG TPA: hypothetical protein VLT16_09835 [Candidatus Limnocylindrales bacterium]|nr:hypothetical protein [Candidatus Limnocylindrales bacterium]
MRLHSLLAVLIVAFAGAGVAVAQDPVCSTSEFPVGIINARGESFRGLAPVDLSGHTGRKQVTLKSMTYDDGPRRIVLVVDASKKLSEDSRKAERTMVESILAAARPQDSFALVTARGTPRVVNFGADHDAILEAVPQDSTSKAPKSGALDAVMQALGMFGASKPGDAIILLAAGLEGNRTTDTKKTAKALAEHHVRLFGLALGPISTRNVTAGGMATSTVSTGLALVTPGIGLLVYDTGDEDFNPLTVNSGGMVVPAMNADPQRSYKMDPQLANQLKLQARIVYNMITSFYRVSVEIPHHSNDEPWQLQINDDVRKSVPQMWLLYPRELGPC